jgi:predicted GTPase
MQRAALVQKEGASFTLLGPRETMLRSRKRVIAVCAVRTGCGKSQTARRLFQILRARGYKVCVIRHPMAYGNLREKVCEKFASQEDLQKCTFEEVEEYQRYIDMGCTVFAGVDYGKVLAAAEREFDVLIWDGGNNDFPFIKPDLWFTLTDPYRPQDGLRYYPGEVNLRSADVVVINKVDTAPSSAVKKLERVVRSVNPRAVLVRAESPIALDLNEPERLRGCKVLAVENGPTLTHGNLSFGAGALVAKKYGAELVDPRPYAVGSLKKTYREYPHIGKVLPAMGYSKKQKKELESTINAAPCDYVILATPADLRKFLAFEKPVLRATYDLGATVPELAELLTRYGF